MADTESEFTKHKLLIYISVVIIALATLHVYEWLRFRRRSVQIPYNSLQTNDENRTAIFVVFTLTSWRISQVFRILYARQNTTEGDNIITNVLSKWLLRLFISMLTGFLYYPLFACISSPYTLLSSVLGILIAVWNLYVLDEVIHTKYLPKNVLILLCITYLLIYFSRRIYLCVKCKTYNQPFIAQSVIRSDQLVYWIDLLKAQRSSKRNFFSNRWSCLQGMLPDTILKQGFVFPTELLACIPIIMMLCYVTITSKLENTVVFHVSSAVSIFLTVLMLIQFMVCLQKDMFDTYAGKREDINKNNLNSTVHSNLLFQGYFISHTFVGFIALFRIVLVVPGVIKLMLLIFSSKRIAVELAFIVLIPALLRCLQYLLVRCFFTNKAERTLDNMKMYQVTGYLVLVSNIVNGIMVAGLRILKTILITIIFVGRIDKNPLIVFKRFDSGYWAYSSFLRQQATFKNPLLRCFCQVLLEPYNGVWDLTTQNGAKCRLSGRGNFSDIENRHQTTAGNKARNRWMLAYTLIHNPKLKIHRRRDLQHKEEGPTRQMKFGTFVV